MTAFLDLNHGNFMPRSAARRRSQDAIAQRLHHNRVGALLMFGPWPIMVDPAAFLAAGREELR